LKDNTPAEGKSFSHLQEFRVSNPGLNIGDTIDVSVFEREISYLLLVSLRKGFQGVVKRHGFKGGRRSHGQKYSEREPGSIGATGPQPCI
jgi:large subunit ribosomal protein L3